MDPASGLELAGSIGNEVMVVPGVGTDGAEHATGATTPQRKPVKDIWLIDPLKVRQHLAKWGKVSVVGVDIKGDVRRDKAANEWRRGGKLAIIQIVNERNEVLMVDCLGAYETQRLFVDSGMKALLEDASVLKVMHDCARSSDALSNLAGVRLCNVFDTYISYPIIFGDAENRPGPPLTEILQHLNIPYQYCVRPTHKMGWFNRPHLAPDQIKYALEGAVHLIEAYNGMQAVLASRSPALAQTCMEASVAHCESARDHDLHVVTSASSYGQPQLPGDWKCPDCEFMNFRNKLQCHRCSRARPSEAGGEVVDKNIRFLDDLVRMGLTRKHCYRFHLMGRCLDAKCGYKHDVEAKARVGGSTVGQSAVLDDWSTSRSHRQQRAQPQAAAAMDDGDDAAFEEALRLTLELSKREEEERQQRAEEVTRLAKEAARREEEERRAAAAVAAAALVSQQQQQQQQQQPQQSAMPILNPVGLPSMAPGTYGGVQWGAVSPAVDEDFFSLVIDAATLLAKVGLVPRLRALVEAAREVGARSSLSQADLYRLVKAMEKKFISVEERQAIVKELRQRVSSDGF